MMFSAMFVVFAAPPRLHAARYAAAFRALRRVRAAFAAQRRAALTPLLMLCACSCCGAASASEEALRRMPSPLPFPVRCDFACHDILLYGRLASPAAAALFIYWCARGSSSARRARSPAAEICAAAAVRAQRQLRYAAL